jgi:superoxide dismutase, Fe-Mn family
MSQGPFELPKLPYAEDALAPYVSANTLSFHHGKHHKAYVDKTNGFVAGTDLEGKSLDEVVRANAGKADKKAVFNNAAQAWNHAFYWRSLTPKGGGKPSGALLQAIERDFGSFDDFRKKLVAEATGHFGSGWAWVVLDGSKLAVMSTHDADTPIAHGQTPLLTLDVWEHAYYLDYQNRRPDYVEAFLDHLLNWGFAAENLSAAKK